MFYLVVTLYILIELAVFAINRHHLESFLDDTKRGIGIPILAHPFFFVVPTLFISFLLLGFWPNDFLSPTLNQAFVEQTAAYQTFLLYNSLDVDPGYRLSATFMALAALRALIVMAAPSIGSAGKWLYAVSFASLFIIIISILIITNDRLRHSYWAVAKKSIYYVDTRPSFLGGKQTMEGIYADAKSRRIECYFESPFRATPRSIVIQKERRFWINYKITLMGDATFDIVGGLPGPAAGKKFDKIDVSLDNSAYINLLLEIDQRLNQKHTKTEYRRVKDCSSFVNNQSDEVRPLLRTLLGPMPNL